jgi:hypothetical protein
VDDLGNVHRWFWRLPLTKCSAALMNSTSFGLLAFLEQNAHQIPVE